HTGGTGRHVLDVVDRVVVAAPCPQVQVDVDRRVHRVPGQRVPGRVHAHGVDEVVQGHHGAGALGHPYRLAVAQQVDQLADEDLQRLVRVVAEAGRHRAQPTDVTVVVGAEHDDDLVEAAFPLVEVVGAVGGVVGVGAGAAHVHPVLVVVEVGGADPD